MSFESDLLRDSAGRLFTDLFDKPSLEARPRPDNIDTIWAKFDEAGLQLAAVAETHGGVGASLADAIALIRLCGAHAVPSPLAETIIANWVWSSLADTKAPEGPVTIAAGGQVRSAITTRINDGWQLDATLVRVPWAAQSRTVLFATIVEGQPSFIAAPLAAAAFVSAQNMALEPRDNVTFLATRLPTSAVIAIASPSAQSQLLEVLALTRAAQLAGAMATALDRTIVYANERVQFGRPIAKFQAIQHQLAMAAGEAAASQASVDLAVALVPDPARFALAAAAAKARASEAAGIVASVCHQTHAAIGFTNEHPLQLYTRQLWAWRDEAGSKSYWHGIVGERVLAACANEAWPLLSSLTPSA